MTVVEEKFKLIQETENGKKKADMCKEFGFINSTIQTMWKNRTTVISVFEKEGLRIKAFLNAWMKWCQWGAMEVF